MMKLIDFSGGLNRHEDYLRILKFLELKSKMIEYVVIGEDSRFIELFENEIICVTSKNSWWGTKTGKGKKAYKLRTTPRIFRYLRSFETFCKMQTSPEFGDEAQITSFGYNDIAFFDGNELPLLYTTTHEGYIFIRNDLAALVSAG